MKRNKTLSNWMCSALSKAPPTSHHLFHPPSSSSSSSSASKRHKSSASGKMRQPPTSSQPDCHCLSKEPSPLTAGTILDNSHSPWSIKHQPCTLAELAVHKKKTTEVQQWLEFALSPMARHPVLLLLGPPGCGKTATLRVLSHEMAFSLLEWSNPIDNIGSREAEWRPGDLVTHTESQSSQFRSFLVRANRYPSLQVGVASVCGQTAERKVVLVEEFPNAFLRDPSKFHEVMNSLCVSLHYPLVFVVSESHRRESSSHTLFSRGPLSALDVHTINFNPIAHTTLVKTLQRIAATECSIGQAKKGPQGAGRGRSKFHMPPIEVIEQLAESSVGDIRSAINTLQFTCLKDSTDLSLDNREPVKVRGQKHPRLKRERSGFKIRRHNSSSGASLAAIGGRDSSLFLFRALGKILYCKREGVSAAENMEVREVKARPHPLPAHLQHCERSPLLVEPESVLEHTHLTTDMFVLYLHQNYIQFFTQLEDITCASSYLSDSDIIGTAWNDSKAFHALTLSCSSSVACRGLMYSHAPPSPPPTSTSSTSSTSYTSSSLTGSRWRPLHKPQWIAVNRKYQESCTSARRVFLHLGTSPHAHLWTPVELQSEIIPHLSLLTVTLRNPDQAALLQSMAHFSMQSTRFHAEALGEKDVECVSGDGQGVCEREVGSQALEGPEEGVQHTASTAGAVMPSPVAAASFPASSQNRAMGAEESCDDIEEFDDDVIW